MTDGFITAERPAVEIVKKARKVYEDHDGDGAWIAMELASVGLITEALASPAATPPLEPTEAILATEKHPHD